MTVAAHILPDDMPAYQAAQLARQHNLNLVIRGRHVLLVPQLQPGDVRIAVLLKEAA